jgi:hypothetical protein
MGVGEGFVCYQDPDGIHCQGQTTPPAPPQVITNATMIALGNDHGCALLNGNMSCWWDSAPSTDVVNHFAGDLTMTAIGAALNATCGSSSTKGIFCGGDLTSYGVVPAGLPKDIAQIAMGTDNICVRTVGNELHCWGNDTYGQLLRQPTIFSNLQDVSVASQFICVVDAGWPQCWGTP